VFYHHNEIGGAELFTSLRFQPQFTYSVQSNHHIAASYLRSLHRYLFKNVSFILKYESRNKLTKYKPSYAMTELHCNFLIKMVKDCYLGLSSSTGSSLAREMLDMTITSMMKLSNNFLVTNQWITCRILINKKVY
jgi:hypothetical protein